LRVKRECGVPELSSLIDGARATTAQRSARLDLREATDAAHSRLHHNPLLAALQAGKLDRTGYPHLLRRLLGLHEPIETQLAVQAGHPWMAWWGDRPPGRAARLRADLAAIGDSAGRIGEVPNASGLLPRLDHPAAALGCAWVVEGSHLGARVLAPAAAAIISSTGPGWTFFAPEQHQLARWRACCDAIEACGADTDGRAAMAAAAAATFAAFEQWLEVSP